MWAYLQNLNVYMLLYQTDANCSEPLKMCKGQCKEINYEIFYIAEISNNGR